MTSAHAENVLHCVSSNFLEVKQLASTLLRQLPPSAVGLQVSSVSVSPLRGHGATYCWMDAVVVFFISEQQIFTQR